MTQVREVRGRRILIRYDAARCIHSRHCVHGRPEVFSPELSTLEGEGDGMHPDAAPTDAVVAIAQACPSGAIGYERLDGEPGEAAPGVNTLRVRENGPFAFHGKLELGGESIGLRATLCRCGASKNKPYCDRSHVEVGFIATGEPITQESTPLEARGGPVRLQLLPAGPLKAEGNLEVLSGTGRTLQRSRRVFLCRCGASANKPFCDGSHSRAGFTG